MREVAAVGDIPAVGLVAQFDNNQGTLKTATQTMRDCMTPSRGFNRENPTPPFASPTAEAAARPPGSAAKPIDCAYRNHQFNPFPIMSLEPAWPTRCSSNRQVMIG